MSQEKLNHVVSGVLFDFMGFLTTRKERIILSKTNNANPAVKAIQDFLKERQIADATPLMQWEDRCSRISKKNEDDNIPEIIKNLKQAMAKDPDYAWGWHCNIACLLLDEGVAHKAANKRAAEFMKLAFDVDTNKI